MPLTCSKFIFLSLLLLNIVPIFYNYFNHSQIKISHNLIVSPLVSLIQNIKNSAFVVEGQLKVLVDERKWEEVILMSIEAIENNSMNPSFFIWYYRALGQCALLKIQECQLSCRKASIYAGAEFQTSIKKMQQFLKLFEKKKQFDNFLVLEYDSKQSLLL